MSKISEYTELTSVAGEDLLVIVDDPAGTPTTKKITRTNLVSGLAASSHTHPISDVTDLQTTLDAKEPVWQTFVLANDVSTAANTTPVNVTGLVFSFAANSKYIIDLYAVMQSPAATTGYGLQFDVSAAVTLTTMSFVHQLANTGTQAGGSSIADDASAGVSSGVPSANTNVPLIGRGLLITTGNTGTAQLRLRSETTAAATIKANSILRVQKVA